ncbi:hypothetical protein PI124_g4536 [Phytophthora idaei]|nr:hypothetical protein PI125_g3187 [Phytophthora idaei]KAG3167594.1 hypothetical protein PI126_g3714 [Phytophthora idaei]KAG3250788.1 hypothetical protein PI124_g4536 [Phytophthora idaei]
MYCDHRNLIHVFAPDEVVKEHVKGELLPWAMKLMNYRYVVEHVPGPDNVWAVMISRWAGNHAPTTPIKRLKTVRSRSQTQPVSALRPLDDDHFVWPTLVELRELQAKFSLAAGANHDKHGIVVLNGRLWIPPEETDLLQRLCMVAHCDAQDHRGQLRQELPVVSAFARGDCPTPVERGD